MDKKIVLMLKQFISYFCVGGIAALVEWFTFFVSNILLGIHYTLATILSFLISTLVNWYLGRSYTFRNSKKNNTVADIAKVYSVSLIGLGFNLLLMNYFVGILMLYPLVGKIVSTGIVFIWNFLIRKLYIYKN